MSDHVDTASPRAPKRGLRRKVVIGLALAGIASAGGLAFGEWLASGNGEGYAKSGTAQALTTESVAPSDTLYPGGKSDLVIRIHNPNPFPVAVHNVMPNGPITSDDPACDAAGHGVTFGGLNVSYLIAANSSQTYTLTDALTMATTSANECQGRQFTIPVALNTPGGTGPTWYADVDGDGFGDPNASLQSETPPAWYIANAGDCDDSNSTVHPGATEVLNMVDDDCDGVIDDNVPPPSEADIDADGYSQAQGDCNDANPGVHPGATEVSNGVDDDCDGVIDDNVIDALTWYKDADLDGFGDPSKTTLAATQPFGYSADNTDCDDLNAAVNPAATEVSDGIDNDCDGIIDES